MSDNPSSTHPQSTLPQPGEPHARLQPFAGTFHSEVRMWLGSGDPMISTGTMTNVWRVGGLFLQQQYVGDAMEGSPDSFQGEGYWGYNTTRQQYEGFWIDNASTTMQMEIGTLDESGKVWEMHSQVTSPHSGQLMAKRSVITLIDDDRHQMEVFYTGTDGNEMKVMEISYTRS